MWAKINTFGRGGSRRPQSQGWKGWRLRQYQGEELTAGKDGEEDAITGQAVGTVDPRVGGGGDGEETRREEVGVRVRRRDRQRGEDARRGF